MNLPINFYVYGDPSILRVASHHDDNLVQVSSRLGTSLFSKASVEKHFADGSWLEISKAEPVERPLVFPFTFTSASSGDAYAVVEHPLDSNCVEIHSKHGVGKLSKLDAREEITKGQWRVTSVGTQAATAPPAPSKEAAKGLDSLVIKVSSEGFVEATEQILKLAEATERLNIAMESLATIFEDTRELLLGSNPSGCVTFCCEEQ